SLARPPRSGARLLQCGQPGSCKSSSLTSLQSGEEHQRVVALNGAELLRREAVARFKSSHDVAGATRIAEIVTAKQDMRIRDHFREPGERERIERLRGVVIEALHCREPRVRFAIWSDAEVEPPCQIRHRAASVRPDETDVGE